MNEWSLHLKEQSIVIIQKPSRLAEAWDAQPGACGISKAKPGDKHLPPGGSTLSKSCLYQHRVVRTALGDTNMTQTARLHKLHIYKSLVLPPPLHDLSLKNKGSREAATFLIHNSTIQNSFIYLVRPGV